MGLEIGNAPARLATIHELIRSILPNLVDPVPSAETLRNWFDEHKIPRFKANPLAKRGGGPCYYSVSAVEKLFRSRTVAGKIVRSQEFHSPRI